MNFLITGGLGFIGSWLAKKLIEQGHYVHIVDRCSTHPLKTYDKARTPLEKNRFCRIDIMDMKELRADELKGISGVFHLAATSGLKACEENPKEAWYNNLNLTKNLLEKCTEVGVKKFIFASSAAVYGQRKVCEETAKTKPTNIYASTKAMAEEMLMREQDIIGVIARFSNIYGMGYYDKPTVVSKFIDDEEITIYGGEQTRDFVHIDDVTDALITLFFKGEKGIYNVGSGKTTSIRKLAKMVGKKPKFVETDRIEPGKGYKYKIDKMKGLKWKPKVKLKQGIEQLKQQKQ
jgi:UDP-glucose 4-epimerase